jgi:hypothetical protein
VTLLKDNFATIAGVFGKDCPICGVNMKKMWCEYTCSPLQYKFVEYTGHHFDDVVNRECTTVTIFLDPGMACQMFKSCQKTSYISQLQLSSSKAFLDFQGSNAKVKSASILSFDLSRSKKEDMLSTEVYDCNTEIKDGKLSGYDNVHSCTCAYCQKACKAPVVNAYIGFFDGMDGMLVLYVYIGVVILSVLIWFVKRRMALRSKDTVYVSNSRIGSTQREEDQPRVNF